MLRLPRLFADGSDWESPFAGMEEAGMGGMTPGWAWPSPLTMAAIGAPAGPQGTTIDLFVGFTSNDPALVAGKQWDMQGDATPIANAYGSQAQEAWMAGFTGSMTVVVGVIDTGIDYTHPDLYLNIWLNQKEIPLSFRPLLQDADGDALITFRDLNADVNAAFVSDLNANGRIDAGDLLQDIRWEDGLDEDADGYLDDLIGWDFNNNDNDPYDDNGHGTHVSGVIGADGANGTGIAGINWSVQLVAMKVFSAGGNGSSSTAAKAVDYFTQASIAAGTTETFVATNNSWGGGGYNADLQAAIERGARQDILFVAAAGNNASNNDSTAFYPANYSTITAAGYEAVIAVASTTSIGELSSFSDYGAKTVDIGAPGSGIYSTWAGGGYSTLSGTSMATPHVTGALALYASANPTASAAQIAAALYQGAAATPSLQDKTATDARLDIGAMMTIAPPTITPPPTASTDTIAGNTSTTATVSVGGNVSSSIDTAGDQDWFRISLTKGERYQITVTATNGSALDAAVTAYNSSGSLLGTNDDAIGLDARLYLTASASGTFFLSAQGSGTSTGAYALSVIRVESNLALTGTTGADSLTGGGGYDTLSGQGGDDTLQGRDGDDSLIGGAGNDLLTGGSGTDRFAVDAGTDTITDLGLGGADALVVSSGATANATLAADWIATNASSNAGAVVLTLAGYDLDLSAAAGLSSARWTLTNAGNATGVAMTGSASADLMLGGDAADTLAGGNGADTLSGGGGADLLTGGAGIDSFAVTAGTDTITDLGQGGADVLTVSSGATALATVSLAWTATAATANAGTAIVTAAGNRVSLAAATGNGLWILTNAGNATAVSLTGSAGADSIMGGDGADALTGGAGADSLAGGAGNDSLTGSAGDDVLAGGAGLDRFIIDGGADSILDLGLGGADSVGIYAGARVVASLAAAWTATTATGNSGTALLQANGFDVNLAAASGNGWTISNAGSGMAVSFTGSSGADLLQGGDGADTLVGGGGQDTLAGGAGDDSLVGSGGGNIFLVQAGTDTVADLGLYGSADSLVIAAGATARGRLAGNWTATAATSNAGTAQLLAADFSVNLATATGPAGWTISNASFSKAVKLTGSANDDQITGGAGGDSLSGGGGADLLRGDAGNDTLAGGTGIDRFIIDAGTDTVTDLGLGGADVLQVQAGAAVTATLAAAWTATSASSNDGSASILATGNNLNLADASGANGWILSNAGVAAAVTILGSAASDTLIGGNGADTLLGGAGNDMLTGGSGVDSFRITIGSDNVLDLGQGGADSLVVALGASVSARLATAWTAGAMTCSDGSASIDVAGYAANLAAAGGAAGWVVWSSVSTRALALTGSANADAITGGDAADTLSGGGGDDTLGGGLGRDQLTGGTGADIFRFTRTTESAAGTARDTITDFRSLDGDRIDLGQIDANGLLAGQQDFTFIGGDRFTAAGQLRFAAGILQADINGDGLADLEIALTTVASLSGKDLIL